MRQVSAAFIFVAGSTFISFVVFVQSHSRCFFNTFQHLQIYISLGETTAVGGTFLIMGVCLLHTDANTQFVMLTARRTPREVWVLL